jgi:hypothetical protein
VNVPLSGTEIPPPPTTQAIAAVLTGDDSNADVDVHLVRPGGAPFDGVSGSDCFYYDCTDIRYLVMWPSPTPGDMSYNPHLDHDPVFEYGTENLNLQNAEAGAYEIYVHYYGTFLPAGLDAHPVSTTVYVAGMNIGTFNTTLTCNQMWHVGTVHWTGSSGTFAPDNAVTLRSEGTCP